MDLMSILGILMGIGAVVGGAFLEHLPPTAIYAPTAFIIVMGGSFGAIMVAFPIDDLKRAFTEGLGLVFKTQNTDYRPLIEEITKVATVARKEGVLAIEGMRNTIQDEKFKKALKFVIDGFEPKTVTEILEMESFFEFEETEVAGKLLEGIGGYTPTVGIIGAVLGLIHVMRNLDNPDAIGPGIAVAFVATVYGVGFANLIFMPMGTKVKRKAGIAQLRNELIKTGVQGIQEGLNPHFLREKLEVYLEHKYRSHEEGKH
ncbi:MAG: flagellar motor protein [Proteobacteria bacterium]|nr:MAG: flagellar motor protein [Pseudomonadota bacterium]